MIPLIALCLGVSGCSKANQATGNAIGGVAPNGSDTPSKPRDKSQGPLTLPVPQLRIAVPGPPPAVLDGKDLSSLTPAILKPMAWDYAMAGEHQKAAQCQYWFVQVTDDGRYDLACWEALAGRVDPAIYWLQESARIGGIDLRWTKLDPDLESVRDDSRWPKLLVYLEGCERYWRVKRRKQTELIVPEGYDGRSELPLVVWLHGMGGTPSDHKSQFQPLANEYKIGFVGVSGTIPTGKTKFAWAEVAEEDYERVRTALTEIRDRIRWREGTAVALGFSQGAMVAFEIAVRHPEIFAGVISVSAGTVSPIPPDAPSAKLDLSRQGFVVVCGAKEIPASIERSDELEHWLKARNGHVLRPSYPDHASHGFPADFEKRLNEWIAYVVKFRSQERR